MRIASDNGLVVGVDTHLDSYTAALCDGRGRLVAQVQVPATGAGYARLLAWAQVAAGGRLRCSDGGVSLSCIHGGMWLSRCGMGPNLPCRDKDLPA